MEYGSGTGLLSFALKDVIPEITLMDNSVEMTKEAQRKVDEQKIKSLRPVRYDIIAQELPTARYDLIFILQTLHHIANTDLFLKKSAQLLNSGAYLVIIDLVKEDGSFHEDEFHGHKGFVQSELEAKINLAGLSTTHYGICHTIEKELEDGSIKNYPLFMMVCKK
jgi:ubiquinone/menaquinone biosynthesis C-methylase UbiE